AEDGIRDKLVTGVQTCALPISSFMAHHIGDFQVSSNWAAICNELCYRVSRLFPDHYTPAAMLPQSRGVDSATCIPELVKCVEQRSEERRVGKEGRAGRWASGVQ